MDAKYEDILCGRCSTTGNGTQDTQFASAYITLITKITLQGYPKLLYSGSSNFFKYLNPNWISQIETFFFKHVIYLLY